MFGIAACSDDGSSSGGSSGSSGGSTSKQVPIYQGMVISSAESASTASAKVTSASLTANSLAGNPYYDDYGNYYDGNGGYYDTYGEYHDGYYDYYYDHNHYRGDYEGKDEDVDTDQPFGEDTPTIEQEVETTLKVTGTGQSMYYADKNEKIYITIKISNPDSYEILSFVLNGTKYTGYMFEDGSDLENIIVKLNVGDVGGINEYTIDEIKYVDGTEIKDVLLNGDTVVKCGVRADDQTYATVSNETHGLDSISFTAKIIDLYNLIEYSDGYAMAVLYDGESLVRTVDLAVDAANTVEFTGLTPNTLYQYAIIAMYDDLSGSGTAINYLYTNAVYTDTIVLFNNITVGQEEISFGYTWYEDYSAATITQLTLASGGKTQTLADSSAASITGLYTNTEYMLTAYYVNLDGAAESISLTFTTLSKATPEVEITTLTSTQETIGYALTVTDTDSVGSLTSVALSLNGKTVETLTAATGTFSSLLSNNEYTVTVIYTYDLNDGKGSHELTVTDTITTLAKATPAVEIETLSGTQTVVNYEFTITDKDGVGSLTSVTLSLGDKVYTATTAAGTFENLLSNNTYTITAVYTYDLNDGTGSHTVDVELTVSTRAKATPVVEIESYTSDQTSVDYSLAVTDKDGVGSLTSVTITNGDTAAYTSSLAADTVSGLLSNNTYTLTAVYTYDLNDGKGEQTITVTKKINTKAKAAPAAEIEYVSSSTTGLTFEVTYTDKDSVGKITAIGLYNGDSLVASISDLTLTTLEFTGLDAYVQYTLKVDYEYDLNDGTDVKEESESLSAYTNPVIEFESLSVRNTSAVSEGETVYIQATMYNPNKATFTSVVVNGETYSVTSVSSTTKLYVEIVNEGQFAGGDTELTISQINYLFNGSTSTINITEKNTVSVFIYGTLTVDNLSIAHDVDGQYEETYYGYSSEQLYYKVSLLNATCYNVTSITIGGTTYDSDDIEQTDDYQTLYVAIDNNYWGCGWYSNTMESISYSNTDETIQKTKTVDVAVAYMRLNCNSGEVVEISSADDLLDVDDWKYYKLVNNIDLLGYEWANMNNNMYGVFDGNGYTISNMSAVTTTENSDLYLGLFKYAGGVVTNLKITDALYMLTLNSDTGNSYYVYAGGIAASTDNSVVIDNCNVEFTVRLVNNSTSGETYIGGVIGRMNCSYVTLNNVEVNSVMDITSYNGIEIGGISGYMWCYQKAAISELDVDLTVNILAGSGYSTSSYFGGYYYNNGTLAVLNSTASCGYTAAYTDSDTIYYGIDGFKFSYSDGEYSLVGYYGLDTDIVLPDNIYGSSYTIGDNAFEGTSLKSITIGSGVTYIYRYAFSWSTVEIIWGDNPSVTEIGENAFYEYKGATLIIPDSVTTIGYWAFQYCTADIVWGDNPSITEIGSETFSNYNGTSITIPDSVTTIDSSAFNGCTAEIIWGDNPSITEIGSGAFGNYKGTSITIPDSVTSISEYAFSNCTATIVWGDNPSITEIGNSAFNGYGGASITIPASVMTIGAWAFSCCVAEIIWADNALVTEIGRYAFFGYSGTSIVIPDSVITIDDWAFEDCTSLISITIGSGVTTINTGAFYNCAAEIIWSENSSITEIGNSAFYGYQGTSITIPDSVTTISSGAFSGCTSLSSINIPNSVTTICDSAFSECTATIVWGNNPSITEIGDSAFANYQGASITIPASVTSIGEWAFQNCTAEIIWSEDTAIKEIGRYAFAWYKGTSIVIPDSVTTIGESAFYECKAESITIGSGVVTIGNGVFNSCTSAIYWSENANILKLANDAFYNYKGTSITIPDSVISIGSSAFNSCTALTSIIIPNSVITIGDNAFYNCSSLTSINIPASVTSIGYNAFYNCSSLESITVNSENKYYKSVDGNLYSYDGTTLIQYAVGKTDTSFEIPDTVTSINSYAFYGCISLESVKIPDSVTYISDSAFAECTSLTSVVISDNIWYISWCSFYNCTSLTSVVIGSEVNSIYSSAFYNCSSLTSIYYNGTEEEWNSIYIESDNEFIYVATVYYYSESKPAESGNHWHYNSIGEVEIW